MTVQSLSSRAEVQHAKVNDIIEEVQRRGGNYLAVKRLEDGDLHGAASQLHQSGMADLGDKVEDIIKDGV